MFAEGFSCLSNFSFFVIQASVYPELHYQSHKTPYFSTDRKTVQLFRPATPYTPTLSELIIENIEQPLKCDDELTVTIKYYFIGETVEDFKTDIVYMVRTCSTFLLWWLHCLLTVLTGCTGQFVIGVSSVCFRSCPEEWLFIMDMRRLKWSLLMEQQVA